MFLYTDGSVLTNPGGAGGWAFLYALNCNEMISGSGGLPNTTNNKAELTAVIKGLESLRENRQAGESICVISDSQYVIYGASRWIYDWKRRGWRNASGKRVLNRELWEELDTLAKLFTTRWSWVRGHNGNPSNEECDRLAGEAARALRSKVRLL